MHQMTFRFEARRLLKFRRVVTLKMTTVMFAETLKRSCSNPKADVMH